jgi:HK97 family phage portal protein
MRKKTFLSRIKNVINWNSASSEDATGFLFKSGDKINFANKSGKDFLNYNEISLYVNRALSRRAEKISEIQFVLRKGDKIIEDPLNPILKLLNRPNNFHTGRQFWELWQKYYDITGRAFILKETNNSVFSTDTLFEATQVKALHILPSHAVKVLFNDNHTEIIGFEYTTKAGTTTYSPNQIIYAFRPDPQSPLEGESLLRAGVRQIETDLQLTEYHANILKNGGHLDNVFKFKEALSKEQIAQMEENYTEKYAEAKRAGKPMFLGGDADLIKLSISPAELGYLESKKMTLDDIVIMTGVPKVLLGLASDETFSNAEAALATFLRDTVKPLLINLTTILDWRFVPEDLDLDFIDPTPEDLEKRNKELEVADKIHAMTINEKRERLGLDPRPEKEANEIMVPFNIMPLSSNEEQAEKRFKTLKEFNHPLRDPFVRKRYGELMIKRMDKKEEIFLKEIRKFFNEQSERIIQGIQGVKKFKKKGLVDEVFDKSLEISIAKRMALPIIRSFLQEAGEDSIELLESNAKFRISAQIETWLDQRAGLFAEEINKTTYDRLSRQFSESLDEGENRQQLVSRIGNFFEETYKGRAATIARTEVHGSVQKGTFEGYRQAAAPIKIWVAVADDRTRESHADIDGEEKPMDVPFSNGLQFPGDPTGDAAETVNCRCSI